MNRSVALAAAELDAQKAWSRFNNTTAAMKARVRPSRLIDNAVTSARSGAAEFAHTASDKARTNPVAVAAIAGGAVLLLARRPLLRMIRQALRQLKA